MGEQLPDDLGARLREAGPEELLELVGEHADRLDVDAARKALANPHCSEEIICLLIDQKRLLAFYEIRKALVSNPRTPQIQALRFVPGLFWSDLVGVGLDTRIPPVIRRAADLRVAELLPSLAMGERMAIARRASAPLQRALSRERQPRVVKALLENPRLTEAVLLPLVASQGSTPAIIEAVAVDRRWGARYPIRVAVCRNPVTPVATALRLLPMLKKGDLRAVKMSPAIHPTVRQRARLLLGEHP